jgi:hypothetical protein
MVIVGASLSSLQGQAPSPNVEQQLRSQYRLTRVGTNGTVVGEAGSVLVMQQDGLKAIPAQYGAYWHNTPKERWAHQVEPHPAPQQPPS